MTPSGAKATVRPRSDERYITVKLRVVSTDLATKRFWQRKRHTLLHEEAHQPPEESEVYFRSVFLSLFGFSIHQKLSKPL